MTQLAVSWGARSSQQASSLNGLWENKYLSRDTEAVTPTERYHIFKTALTLPGCSSLLRIGFNVFKYKESSCLINISLKKFFYLMKHSYKGRNYWKSGCSFVGNDVLSTRQSWVDRKGRQTHTAVKLSPNTSAWMTEWTLNSDCLSPHPETLLLGWWAKLLRLFHLWDGITVNFLKWGGLSGVILGKPQTPKAVTDSSSSWQHCCPSSGCFLHFPLPSGQSKLRW